jgi:Flp pilus assembly pilin Flp
MTTIIRRMMEDTSGATLVEYTLLITLVAVLAIVAIKALGTNTSTLLSTAAASV